jgi:transposase
MLALKTFFKTDYRGVVQLFKDFAELQQDLKLTKIPHFSTLCYAAQRLLKKGRLLASSIVPPRPQSNAA